MFRFLVFADPTITISDAFLASVAAAAGVTILNRELSSASYVSLLSAQAVLIRSGAKLSNIWFS